MLVARCSAGEFCRCFRYCSSRRTSRNRDSILHILKLKSHRPFATENTNQFPCDSQPTCCHAGYLAPKGGVCGYCCCCCRVEGGGRKATREAWLRLGVWVQNVKRACVHDDHTRLPPHTPPPTIHSQSNTPVFTVAFHAGRFSEVSRERARPAPVDCCCCT